MEEKRRLVTIRRQSGRILQLYPTAVAVATVVPTTLIMEWITGNADYRIAFHILLFAVGILALLLVGLVLLAFCGKPLCTVDEQGIHYKGKTVYWMNIVSMEYVFGYTRYYGDRTRIKIVSGYEEIVLPHCPIWFFLLAKKYLTACTVTIPHLKKHFWLGIKIGLVLSAIVVSIYLL